MGRSFQDRYVVLETAVRRAERLEAQTGKHYFVSVDLLGYYCPMIDRQRLNIIKVIQSVEKSKQLIAKRKLSNGHESIAR